MQAYVQLRSLKLNAPPRSPLWQCCTWNRIFHVAKMFVLEAVHDYISKFAKEGATRTTQFPFEAKEINLATRVW